MMERRRKFAPEFKSQVVLELVSGAKSVAEICREHQLASQVVSAWREEFVRRAPEIFAKDQRQTPEQQRIADLERLVGRLTMELEVAKKASSILASRSTKDGR
jgi:transposase-like protein